MCYSFINPITRRLSMTSPRLHPVLSGCSPWCWICPPHVVVAPWLLGRQPIPCWWADTVLSHSRGLIKLHAPIRIPCFDRHAFEVHYCVSQCALWVSIWRLRQADMMHVLRKCQWETYFLVLKWIFRTRFVLQVNAVWLTAPVCFFSSVTSRLKMVYWMWLMLCLTWEMLEVPLLDTANL